MLKKALKGLSVNELNVDNFNDKLMNLTKNWDIFFFQMTEYAFFFSNKKSCSIFKICFSTQFPKNI